MIHLALFFAAAVTPAAEPAKPAPPAIPKYPEPATVATAMKKAAQFYRQHVSVAGGYAWQWPRDLSDSKGENRSSPSLIMIQPPGTPAMGLAMLDAFKATGDPLFKQAVREAAQSLMWCQLASGGWDSDYDFAPKVASKYHYRRDIEAGDTERGKRHAMSTLDDDKTESALLFLLEMAHTPAFANDADLKAALKFGLDGLLAGQAPCGGWGQGFDGPADPKAPVIKASLPKEWSRTFPAVNYTRHYTLNDGNLLRTVRVLLRAHELTSEARYLESAKRVGDFLLLARLPAPQPAWAQQYDPATMHPAWARKFEPPSLSSLESLGALRTLLDVWAATGDDKYRAPHAEVLAWLEKSKLPDGQWARFYELGTNKALYCKRETYELTHDDSDLPTHYGFKIDDLAKDIAELQEDMQLDREAYRRINAKPTDPKKSLSRAKSLATKVVKALTAQSKDGAWLVNDMIDAGEFVKHFKAMSLYLETAKTAGALFDDLRKKER